MLSSIYDFYIDTYLTERSLNLYCRFSGYSPRHASSSVPPQTRLRTRWFRDCRRVSSATRCCGSMRQIGRSLRFRILSCSIVVSPTPLRSLGPGSDSTLLAQTLRTTSSRFRRGSSSCRIASSSRHASTRPSSCVRSVLIPR